MVDKVNAVREEVVRELPPVGKYRIRLVRNARRPEAPPALDIREYVTSETFEGFTRRGIRLTESAQIELLRDALAEILGSGALQVKA
jgi:hypothetical protein